MKKALACLMMMFGPVTGWAGGGIDLSLSSEAASLDVLLNPQGSLSVGGTTELSLGVLTNETGDNIFHGTLLARGVRTSVEGQYNLGAGMRLVGGDLDVDETVGALALGFQASVLIAPSKFNPMDFIMEGFYAPKISSFTDAEEYTSVGVKLQIDVVPQARAYLGYRRVTFDTNDFSNVIVDKSVHAGLSIRF